MLTAKQSPRLPWFHWILCALSIHVGCGILPLDIMAAPTEKQIGETQVVATDKAAPMDPMPASAPSATNGENLEGQRRILSELKGPPEAVWIQVGTEKVLGFWREDASGKPVGAVLLLPASGQNPRSGPLLRLHEYLPLYGWATLSIELPEIPPSQIPPRPLGLPGESAPTAENSGPTDESQVVHQEPDASKSTAAAPIPPAVSGPAVHSDIQQRITAATHYLNQKGHFNLVLLGEGISALWVLEHLDQAVIPDTPGSAGTQTAVVERAIRAVILLDPRVPESLPPQKVKDLLHHPKVPTLDAYTDFSPAARRAARDRKQTAIKAGYEVYVLKRLTPTDGLTALGAETNITKTLRGFLKQHAQGTELN